MKRIHFRIKHTTPRRSTKRANTSWNETSSSTSNEDGFGVGGGMTCRLPCGTVSVFGSGTLLAYSDLAPGKTLVTLHC